MNASQVKVGTTLPRLSTGRITRHRIARYAHGSGDINPIHVDSDFARGQAGLPDVIVHGMYSMGMLARLLAGWAGPGSVRWVDTRFAAMLPVLESLDCDGVVEAVESADHGVLATVKLTASRSDGSVISSGSALVFVKG